MIINSLEINPGATSISVSVEVDTGNTIVQVLAWNKDSYQDESEAIDLTSLLSGLDETEDFSISASDLGVEQITGFYAVKFVSSDAVNEDPQTGIVVNLLPYYECILNKVLAVSVKGCKTINNSCGEADTLLFASTLLDTVNDAILFGLYDEAIQILNCLEEVCEVCTACPDYGTDLSHTGYGYKTINNIVILA